MSLQRPSLEAVRRLPPRKPTTLRETQVFVSFSDSRIIHPDTEGCYDVGIFHRSMVQCHGCIGRSNMGEDGNWKLHMATGTVSDVPYDQTQSILGEDIPSNNFDFIMVL